MSSTGRKRNWGQSHHPIRQSIALKPFINLTSFLSLHRPIFEWNPSGADDFSRTLYQNILSRDPEEGACHYWGNNTRAHGVASTINASITSKEFHLKRLSHGDIVEKLYRTILGRGCRDDEKTEQVVRLRNGNATSVIISGLLGSDEYRQRVELGSAPSLNIST